MKVSHTLFATSMVLALGCATVVSSHAADAKQGMVAESSGLVRVNPFYHPWGTYLEIPDFGRIQASDYKPAFLRGIEERRLNINAIIENPAPASFYNTILAMENAAPLLQNVSSVFYGQRSANPTPEITALSKELAPILSSARDDIYLNEKLFKRVKAVYDQRDKLQLDEAKLRLLEDTYLSFSRGGANLSQADKTKLRSINSDISKLGLAFRENILADTNKFKLVIDNQDDLAGLPADVIAAAAATARNKGLAGKWVFTIQKPSYIPFMTYANNRELRQQMYQAYTTQADHDDEHDNKKLLAKIASLRVERAQLLGYRSHADYVMEERTAKKPENVYALLDKLWPAALAKAKDERAQMQQLIDNTDHPFKLKAWDWRYYANKIRTEKYDFDEQQTKPYFSLDNTIKGMFYTANRLYGLTFVERDDLPKYHPDVRTYEVHDKDGSVLGIFMGDYYVRDNKRSGAWASPYRKQQMKDGKRVPPIVVNVLNLAAPIDGKPVLLTFDEASTVFHEFGHALHHMLSNVQYTSQAGTAVPTDYVEFPSQVNENWMTEPEVLAQFAHHVDTGEVIPQALIDKALAAGKFNQGFNTVEYLAATKLDLDWHSLTDTKLRDAAEFEQASLEKMGLIDEIPPRYRSTYFGHIFSSGYSAGYYSYIWADILGADAFEAFKEHGIFDKATADAFRDKLLSKGGSRDPMQMYRDFRGKDADIQPLLKSRGLL
ncbi:M3 family metallopeptidase [Shewanella sp. C32]|uniref:M3 family metallopeptidase n=1 Tax=Shewanella electrica TaxID=515560 RepID=A0ABT2FJU5_9GAMM|nr:M3 family metallopeptidase [Shewanella electrica]MCS4556603.1 M3 family metallopeptidase [Shewanella electrica]